VFRGHQKSALDLRIGAVGLLAWSVRNDPDDEAAVVRLVSRPYVVEVLDALMCQPVTQHRLRRVLRLRRSRLTVALRALAAYGAIRRGDQHGSWDGRDPAPTLYELTDIGRGLLDLLQQMDVWDSFYERYPNRGNDDC